MNQTRINVVINEDLDKEFRAEIARRLGLKKGNIQAAIEEAIRDWIKKEKPPS